MRWLLAGLQKSSVLSCAWLRSHLEFRATGTVDCVEEDRKISEDGKYRRKTGHIIPIET